MLPKQASIWNEKIKDDMTIEEFVKEKIENYSAEITQKITDKGILDRMKLFLKNLTEVKIEPMYQTRELNLEAKVKFIENGKETNIDKKGDGTKRRISMALLEFKKTESLLTHDESTIYLLDEPDTHLHVKAHVTPRKIRLLENNLNQSKIRYLKTEVDSSDYVLKSLGVENVYLFFARYIVIVEGETEENFVPSYFLKKYGRTIASSLIKIINVRGITNIPGFSRAILELHDPKHIYLLFDNDASPELLELINSLGIPDEQKFITGDKEFEDSFESHVLHRCWAQYLTDSEKQIPENWSIANIEAKKAECMQVDSKFSKELRSLNAQGKKMTKPIFGKILGEYIDETELPVRLRELFSIAK